MSEGTVTFKLRHAHADWATNDKAYKFGPLQRGPVSVLAFKHHSQKLELRFTVDEWRHTFTGTALALKDGMMAVTLAWKHAGEWVLFINGQQVQSATFLPVRH